MRYRRLFVPGGTWFFTHVTADRRPLFRDAATVALLRESFRQTARRFPFTLHAAVVLPDHLHVVLSLPEGDADFPLRWQQIKGRFTKALPHRPSCSAGQAARREQPVWQKRYWEHLIRDDDDHARHVDYIHLNPLKHGLVEDPRDWPWSSLHRWLDAGWYGPEGPPTEALDRLTVVGDP